AHGKLQITTVGTSPIVIDLLGTVQNIVVTAAQPVIPTTPVGQTSANFDVVLSNVGNTPWLPGVPVITGPFLYRSGGSSIIPVGSQSIINLAFVPTTVGANNGMIRFTNSQPALDYQFDVPLNGTGLGINAVGSTPYHPELRLENNFPNPVSAQTIFSYDLPTTTHVYFTISTVSGNLIERLVDQNQTSGLHSLTYDVSKLASGTYIYTVQTESGSLSKTMTISK
ncbi:MAG: T9SS type A sorting domain-containing protein, partial [Ignavibacteriota bacterium]